MLQTHSTLSIRTTLSNKDLPPTLQHIDTTISLKVFILLSYTFYNVNFNKLLKILRNCPWLRLLPSTFYLPAVTFFSWHLQHLFNIRQDNRVSSVSRKCSKPATNEIISSTLVIDVSITADDLHRHFIWYPI